ncbi:MAG TPA: DNA repair protein RecO [Gammaproteobacteria bacterium]|nr:DNA repair protein RecO [Gammaproteobacteria bacterium]
MTERVLLQPAYVLHQRAYRDTSAIIELFTPEHGRIGVVAKGVRGAKPRWRGLLQSFQPLLVSFNLRGELGLLTAAEAQGGALTLQPRLLASGFYLNEILLRLLQRHDAQLELFDGYDSALRELAQLRDDQPQCLENILRRFELRLLAALGYGLVLDHDVQSGMAVQAAADYVYFLEHGPVRVDDAAGQISAHGLGGQQAAQTGIRVSGDTLLALQADRLNSAEQRREAKQLLRAALGQHLGPKPLQSRQLLRQGT